MNTLTCEPENTVNQTQEVAKRGRGRPPKPKTESSQSVSPNRDSEVKKSRGRPAKYAPEERKEKYLEKIKNWQEENADKVKEYNRQGAKTFYDNNKEKCKTKNTDYQIRARKALIFLSDLLDHWDNLKDNSDIYKSMVREIVDNKKSIII
jgi:hypothetical protein